jgi:hypothetical protein
MSERYYLIGQTHAPSGGLSFVDRIKYKTREEAQAVASQLMNDRDPAQMRKYPYQDIQLEFPNYFPVCLKDIDDNTIAYVREDEE